MCLGTNSFLRSVSAQSVLFVRDIAFRLLLASSLALLTTTKSMVILSTESHDATRMPSVLIVPSTYLHWVSLNEDHPRQDEIK
jgi:hypothetical protein